MGCFRKSTGGFLRACLSGPSMELPENHVIQWPHESPGKSRNLPEPTATGIVIWGFRPYECHIGGIIKPVPGTYCKRVISERQEHVS
jgi:hypothetical protein